MKIIKNKKVYILISIFFLAALTLFILEKTHVTNLISKEQGVASDDAKTTSTVATAQEGFKDGDPRTAGNTLGENKGSGAIKDNNGAIDGSVDTTNPISSKTGDIKLFTPKNSSVVNNGSMVSGTSTLSSVSYRLIDNISGVIASGDMRVVNGKFSGNLSFNTSASEGRLDVFGVRGDGTEFSNIESSIRFK